MNYYDLPLREIVFQPYHGVPMLDFTGFFDKFSFFSLGVKAEGEFQRFSSLTCWNKLKPHLKGTSLLNLIDTLILKVFLVFKNTH